MYLDGLLEFMGGLRGVEWLYYFWPFFVIDFGRYVFLDGLVLARSFLGATRRRRLQGQARKILYSERPLVSVLVPGKNEGRHIPALVESLANQSYRNIELVVVDDGSDDDTAAICRRLKREGKIAQFVRNEPRGGKASAANTALFFSKGELIVHLDADSNLRYDAIERIILPFYIHPNLGAVGGDIRVANTRTSLATRCQALDYLKAISIGRTVSAALGLLRIVSGAFGAFRREDLERLGGWDVGPGLDGDLTMKLRKLGRGVVHEPEAVCYTNVPTTFRKLARQRYRWDRSMVRFRMRKHSDVFRLNWSSFSWRNFVSSVENVGFTLGLNLKWWIYFTQMLILHPNSVRYLVVINYFLYVATNTIQYAVAWATLRGTLRRVDRRLLGMVFFMPIYTGIFLRLVRTFGHLMEIFHRVSYTDRWNPWKVSRVAKQDAL